MVLNSVEIHQIRFNIFRWAIVSGSGSGSVFRGSGASEYASGCQCWLDEIEPECVCRGQQIYSIPRNLTNKILRL